MRKLTIGKKVKEDLIVTLTLVIGLLFVFGYGCYLAGGAYAGKKAEDTVASFKFQEDMKNIPDLRTLLTQSNEAMQQYNYFAAYIELASVKDGVESNHFYSYRTDKERTGTSYTFHSLDGTEESNSVEFWCPNPEKTGEEDDYSVWIWSRDVDSFVKTTRKDEPIKVKSWDLFEDVDYMVENYYIDKENHSQDFGVFETPCWVVTTMGYIGEEQETLLAQSIFISKETFLPLGIVSQSAEGVLKTGGEASIGENSTVSSYEFTWTNEDIYKAECPTRYVTEEEFLELVKGE